MNPNQIAFLNRFNPQRTVEMALSRAIAASVQHNSLYHPNANEKLREEVRCKWRSILQEISERYSEPDHETDYENDIKALKDLMNAQFSHAFRDTPHPRYRTEPGFRISHAQKSIGVFLKHLWCMGRVPMPPQCPVDARILAAVGVRYPENRWGYINSLDEHRAKIEILRNAQNNNFESLAEWELITFNLD